MKEYGGYLPLELLQGSEYYQNNVEYGVLSVNCGRTAFYCALLDAKPEKIYLPHFNCKMSLDPILDLGIDYEFYYLDDDLTPKDICPKENEMVMWINYYGNASSEQIQKVVHQYFNLLIDNCHAFFNKPIPGVYNAYSCRKFFGVNDGAYLIKNKLKDIDLPDETSYENAIHLLKSLDCSTNAAYAENLANETRLEHNYRSMSKLTHRILQSIDYDRVYTIRRRNWETIHAILGGINDFPLNLDVKQCMCYPFLKVDDNLRKKLIENKIYVPSWWAHVPEQTGYSELETKLSKYVFVLPIDQRYTEDDMIYLGNFVKKALGGA